MVIFANYVHVTPNGIDVLPSYCREDEIASALVPGSTTIFLNTLDILSRTGVNDLVASAVSVFLYYRTPCALLHFGLTPRLNAVSQFNRRQGSWRPWTKKNQHNSLAFQEEVQRETISNYESSRLHNSEETPRLPVTSNRLSLEYTCRIPISVCAWTIFPPLAF